MSRPARQRPVKAREPEAREGQPNEEVDRTPRVPPRDVYHRSKVSVSSTPGHSTPRLLGEVLTARSLPASAPCTPGRSILVPSAPKGGRVGMAS